MDKKLGWKSKKGKRVRINKDLKWKSKDGRVRMEELGWKSKD